MNPKLLLFRISLSCALALTSLHATFVASAADIVWTNTAGGNWGNPVSWSPNLVPGPPDNARITNAGTYVVQMDVDATVSRLFLGGASGTQSLNQANHILTLRNSSQVGSNGAFLLQSGILDGAGDLLIEGTLDWKSGTMQGTGRTVFPDGRPYRIEGGFTRFLSRPLELQGGGVVVDNALRSSGNGVITVYPGKTLEIIAPGGLPGPQANKGTVNNLGTVLKTGSGLSVVDIAVNNNGVLQAKEGTLQLLAGGISSGTFDVMDAATLDFAAGVHTMSNGVAFSTIGSGRLRASSGMVRIPSDLTIEAPFELAGEAVLDGDGDVTFGGGLIWTGGAMQGTGKTIIPATTSLSITGIANSKILLRDLDLHGTGILGGDYLRGNLLGGQGATLTIHPGATFGVPVGQRFIHHSGAPAVIQNLGTFRRTAGSQIDIGFVFNNAGLVQLEAGWLVLTAGGTTSGAYEQGDGTLLTFGGGVHDVNAGAAFSSSGSGFIRVNGGVFRVNSDLTMDPTFELTAQGTLDGEGTITFGNTFNWAGGTMQGGGRTVIAENARVAIQGNSFAKTLQRSLDLHGYGSMSGTNTLLGGTGGSLTIFPDATFDLLDDPTLAAAGVGDVAALVNHGLLRKPEGNGTATIGFRVTNAGVVDSQSGTMRFSQSYVQTDGATLLSGGNLAGNVLNLQGGQLSGAGNIDAMVQSAADIFPGAPLNFLNMSGAALGGTLNIQIGGVTPGSQHDQLRVNGTASLAGALNIELINGFVPAVGNEFTVMTYAARSGAFSGISAPPGVFFTTVYSPTSLVLRTVTEDDVLTPLHVLVPSGFVGTSTNRALKLTMSGEPGRNYEMLAHKNVNAPLASWEVLGLMTSGNRLFEYRDTSATNPVPRFYRARQVP